jgi:AcrR family transcriptional regulator
MPNDEFATREKILLCALELFFSQGIKKTSVEEIAHQAGVTRITVYRYFAGKKYLVQAAILRSEQVFKDGLRTLEQNPNTDLMEFLDQLGEGLDALPSGDLAALLNELKRLYPGVYADFQEARATYMNGIFGHLFCMLENQNLLRSGLNREIVQALFWESLINIFDNPGFNSFGLSNVELYRVVTDTLLYGMLKGNPPASEAPNLIEAEMKAS